MDQPYLSPPTDERPDALPPPRTFLNDQLHQAEGMVAVQLGVGLDEAVARLSSMDERLGRVVECRFFGGLTDDETAQVLGVTPRTVRRDWVKAKGWLFQELRR